MSLKAFTDAYIGAALWSSLDDNDRPLDAEHGDEDLAPETREAMARDCAAFYGAHDDLFTREHCSRGSGEYSTDEQAGHDFWLTRNGHGAGFWDGDWTPKDVADRLTDASKAFGEYNLYIGDDGRIYGSK